MSDIVDELRAESERWPRSDISSLFREGIAEIQSLRAERDALQARIDGAANVTARVGYHGGCMLYGPEELAGKRVALVPLDD
jgi:hypothetical protein